MVSVDMITYRYMALHVQTTDDIDENCIYVNHSFLFILGDIEDRSES